MTIRAKVEHLDQAQRLSDIRVAAGATVASEHSPLELPKRRVSQARVVIPEALMELLLLSAPWHETSPYLLVPLSGARISSTREPGPVRYAGPVTKVERAAARAIWSSGYYPNVAARLEPVAVDLVEAAGVSAQDEMLDVAAGTGNVAVAAARAGARVTAADLTSSMIAMGRARTEAEGLRVGWIEADCQHLPFPDARFDVTLSAFGAIFAPDPEVAAREMLRVTRPGGVVGMAAWIRGEDEYSRILARHLPSPPGHGPFEWGDEETARARFKPAKARTAARNLRLTFDDVEEAGAFFLRDSVLPAMARGSMEPKAVTAFEDDLRGWIRDGRLPDGRVDIDRNPWLLILATRR